MIIDFHVHIGKSEKSRFRYFSFENYLKLMDNNGISKSIAMPNISNVISWDIINDDHLKAYYNIKDRIIHRFYPFLLINPLISKTYDQISTYSNDCYGLKYHPSVVRVPVNDTKMYKFFDIAAKKNLPIIIHCGRDPISRISYLIDVASKFPSTKFVAAHMGGNASDLIDDAIEALVKSKPENIWLDTSSGKCPWLIENAVNSLGHYCILFGSDEPYADLRIAIKLIEIADISIEAKEHIFYKNAISILDDLKS